MIHRPSTPSGRPREMVAAVLAVGLAACSGGVGAPTAPATIPTAAPTAAASTATPRPTASPRTPTPAALQGRWRTVISDADQPVLTITDFKYTIERLGIGTGAIEVSGDQIRFYGSNLCTGDGNYRWSIDGDSLTLTPEGPDACANRGDAISGRTFKRMS